MLQHLHAHHKNQYRSGGGERAESQKKEKVGMSRAQLVKKDWRIGSWIRDLTVPGSKSMDWKHQAAIAIVASVDRDENIVPVRILRNDNFGLLYHYNCMPRGYGALHKLFKS